METITLTDGEGEFDRLVKAGLLCASPMTIATKANVTDKGKPGAVIAFDVLLPDGTVQHAQAMTTVRLLQYVGKELVKRFGDLDVPDGSEPSRVHDFNPGSVIGDQMREHWQQLAALLVWKLARQGVSITDKDMARYAQEVERGEAMFYFLGQHDRINFKIVDRKRAEELAAYDRAQRGHA